MSKQSKGGKKMSKNYGIWSLVAVGIIALFVGAIGYEGLLDSREFTQAELDTAKTNAKAEGVASVKITEVIKEVLVDLDVKSQYIDPAIQEFLDELSDDKDGVIICGHNEYDIDQMQLKKLNDYNIEFNDNGEYTVNFDAKFKFLDKDVQEKCYKDYTVSVEYPKDTDSEPIAIYHPAN